MGVEFKLFIRIVVDSEGKLVGTPEELADLIGEEARTLTRWIAKLSANGTIQQTSLKHRQIELRLGQKYQDLTLFEKPSPQPTAPYTDDPEYQRLCEFYWLSKKTGVPLKYVIVSEVAQRNHSNRKRDSSRGKHTYS